MQVLIPHPVNSTIVDGEVVAPWLDTDTDKAVINRPWRVCLNGEWYEVPAGYYTDWASIPRIMQWLYPPDKATFRPAALFHDRCYSHWWPVVSKSFADKAFLAILKHSGVPIWRRWVFYAAVRIGGKGGWHRVKTDAHPFWKDQLRRVTGRG